MVKFKRPDYCAQPTVESCQICSLVNYGRDCANNPIGPGRPAMPPDEKRKNRSFKVTDDEWERIGELAKEEGLNISEYIRRQTLGKTM